MKVNPPTGPDTSGLLPVRDPFAALPVVAPMVRTKEDGRGGLQLKQSIPPGRGLRGWLARNFGMHRARRVDLDEHGAAYWQLIDGHRNLREIESALRARFGLNEQASKDAVIVFTKMLLRRGLILLDLGTGRPEPTQSSTTKHQA